MPTKTQPEWYIDWLEKELEWHIERLEKDRDELNSQLIEAARTMLSNPTKNTMNEIAVEVQRAMEEQGDE